MDATDDLVELLHATQSGLLAWKQVNGDRYEASDGDNVFAIEYRYPLFSDEENGSDRGVAIVDLPLLGRTQFFSGTRGMQLTWEILAVNLPSWQRHLKWYEERRAAFRNLLRSLSLNQSGEKPDSRD